MFQNKSSLVATLATLSSSSNLHKSKMAARRHFEKSTFKVFFCYFSRPICLFWGFKHAESVSDVIFAFRCLATSNSKMAASRHFEKSAF